MNVPRTTPSDEMKVVLPASAWAQIVFRVRESDDAYLRQLVEQAAAAAESVPVVSFRAGKPGR